MLKTLVLFDVQVGTSSTIMRIQQFWICSMCKMCVHFIPAHVGMH